MKHRVELTPQEEDIFKRTLKTGNLDIFTEHFFRLPWSGTWFTTEDRVERYDALHAVWTKLGKPDDEWGAVLDGVPTRFKVMWDDYYNGYPMFLLPHGFRAVPWVREFVRPAITKGIAVTGTGSGKTAGLAIAALAYCALYPGFGFLNVAQRQATSQLMLGEVVKWVTGSPYERFLVISKGTSNIWKERPYPTLTVQVGGVPSTFTCQTLGRASTVSDVAGEGVLGQGQDMISVEEAQLVENVRSVKNVSTTRLRGTRANGIPRWTMMRWITNPGANPELRVLIEEYERLQDNGDKSVLVLRGLDSSANPYVTQKQLREQAKEMSQQEQDRWLGGMMSAVIVNSDFGDELLENCRDLKLEQRVSEIGRTNDSLGLTHYELPFNPDRNYVAVGDFGKSHLVGLHSINVPAIMVFDITDFLRRPTKLVALYWFSGEGKYNKFVDTFEHAMVRYCCVGYYDATTIQTAMEDLNPVWAKMPTTPVLFSGEPGKKQWALGVLICLLGDKQFSLPYIRGLWHQSRMYELKGRKKADDLVATLMVFALALRYQGDLWNLFADVYNWEEMRNDRKAEEVARKPIDPFGRLPL
jgi:hypothetical protein